MMDVFPDFGGLGGIGDLKVVIGAMLTIILVIAVLMVIVSAILWTIASSTGNPSLASKGRVGVLVATGAAALAGCGITWINWLINLGKLL